MRIVVVTHDVDEIDDDVVVVVSAAEVDCHPPTIFSH